MTRLKNLEPIVLEILENNKRARSDDFVLYGAVLKRIGVPLDTHLFNFLAKAKEKNMPSFESVTRVRRHICELRQDLKGNAVAREESEEDYKIYNLSGLGD